MLVGCLLSDTICLNLELPLVILWARETKPEPETWVISFKLKDSRDFLSLDSPPHQCLLLSRVSLPYLPLLSPFIPSPSLIPSVALTPTLEKAMRFGMWELIQSGEGGAGWVVRAGVSP